MLAPGEECSPVSPCCRCFAGVGAPSGVGSVELRGGIALYRGPGLTDDDGDWRHLVDGVVARGCSPVLTHLPHESCVRELGVQTLVEGTLC